MKTLLIILILISLPAEAELVDIRFCGAPLRDSHNHIIRYTTVLNHFKKLWPCPSTGLTSGPCPGWAIDHVIPLSCGGCDDIINLQWLPDSQKSCAGNCKDRWERKIYGGHQISKGCP